MSFHDKTRADLRREITRLRQGLKVVHYVAENDCDVAHIEDLARQILDGTWIAPLDHYSEFDEYDPPTPEQLAEAARREKRLAELGVQLAGVTALSREVAAECASREMAGRVRDPIDNETARRIAAGARLDVSPLLPCGTAPLTVRVEDDSITLPETGEVIHFKRTIETRALTPDEQMGMYYGGMAKASAERELDDGPEPHSLLCRCPDCNGW
jgi:hypothetical protein